MSCFIFQPTNANNLSDLLNDWSYWWEEVTWSSEQKERQTQRQRREISRGKRAFLIQPNQPNTSQYYSTTHLKLNTTQSMWEVGKNGSTAHPPLDDLGSSHSIDGITGQSWAATPASASLKQERLEDSWSRGRVGAIWIWALGRVGIWFSVVRLWSMKVKVNLCQCKSIMYAIDLSLLLCRFSV